MDSHDFRVTLCALPADSQKASETGFPICHLAYRAGKNGRLYRGALGIGIRGGLLGVSDRDIDQSTPYDAEFIHELKRECDMRGYNGILCDFEQPPSSSMRRFAYEAAIYFASMRMDFYLPEAYAPAAPGAKILVSSHIVSGRCEEVFRNALRRYGASRTALVFDPVCIDFAMPAPRPKNADRITPEQLETIRRREGAVVYFSHELTANYFTYRTGDGQSRFALFDDARSMMRKLELARRAGFKEAFVCYPDAQEVIDKITSIFS